MALPKLDIPTYETILPSTGKPIEFRPFLVKEEKILLMVSSDNNPKEKDILRAVKQIIGNCVLSPEFDISKCTSYDIEKIFLELRSKSVGEIINLRFRHSGGKNRLGKECSHTTQVEIPIDDIELVWKEKVEFKIQLTDTVGIKLRHPSVNDVEAIADMKGKTNSDTVERIMALLRRCTEYIWDEQSTYKIDDANDEELIGFFDALTSDQFKKIEKFFESAPQLQYVVKYKCEGCGEDTEHLMKGLRDFFL